MIEIKHRHTGVVLKTVDGAYLGSADLRSADLRSANLCSANLRGADLRGADLYGADLRGAYLRGADLRGAYLHGATYSISQVLLASWGDVSPDLCCHLMRLDASAWPDGERLISEWAAGGECPAGKTRIERAALFREKRELWGRDVPRITLWELWVMLAKEKGVKI